MNLLQSVLIGIVLLGLFLLLPPLTLLNIAIDLAIILGTAFMIFAIKLVPSYNGKYRNIVLLSLPFLAVIFYIIAAILYIQYM